MVIIEFLPLSRTSNGVLILVGHVYVFWIISVQLGIDIAAFLLFAVNGILLSFYGLSIPYLTIVSSYAVGLDLFLEGLTCLSFRYICILVPQKK